MSGFAFWDTNLFIYWLEDRAPWSDSTRALVDWQETHEVQTVTSSLTLGELLVHPLRSTEGELARSYARLLTELGCLSFGPNEAWRFAELRSAHPGLSPPDAIQLACASIFGVDHFFTNDNRLSKVDIEGIGRIRGLWDWRDE